jgi:hypothetical protein
MPDYLEIRDRLNGWYVPVQFDGQYPWGFDPRSFTMNLYTGGLPISVRHFHDTYDPDTGDWTPSFYERAYFNEISFFITYSTFSGEIVNRYLAAVRLTDAQLFIDLVSTKEFRNMMEANRLMSTRGDLILLESVTDRWQDEIDYYTGESTRNHIHDIGTFAVILTSQPRVRFSLHGPTFYQFSGDLPQ